MGERGLIAPKLFVSYSWSSPDHEDWVLRFATELSECGVDVILDKWDLKEGNDAHVFMEKMVTDPEIRKVVLVCDESYARKTDGRTGGVGTEAQIISSGVYSNQEQDKFVAVVVERDTEGKAYLPAYYRSRIYIDLSDSSIYGDGFEQLLRWIFDKPMYEKPELGSMPAFLSEADKTVVLATGARFRRAVEAIRGGRDYAVPAVEEYFDQLVGEFENLRLESSGADAHDDWVVESIGGFLPYRNEAIDIFLSLALYVDTPDTRRLLRRFFERLIPFMSRPENVTSSYEWDWDNYKFLVHELFLYAVAALLRYERFESAGYLLDNQYYLPGNSDYGCDVMVDFDVMRQCMKSLEHRNSRMKLNRLSVRADMLKERCVGIGLESRHIMQADFVAFIRSELDHFDNWQKWWPETLIWLGRHSSAMEIFARARSRAYFEQLRPLLGVEVKEEMTPLLDSYASGGRKLPKWQFDSFSPKVLLGFDELSTRP